MTTSYVHFMSSHNQHRRRRAWPAALALTCLYGIAAFPTFAAVPAGATTKVKPTKPKTKATIARSKSSKAPQSEVSPAGDIPDNQAFVPFSPQSARYTVSVPEGWARTEIGSATNFTDKLNTIRLEASIAPGAPSTATALSDELPIIKLNEQRVSAARSSRVTRKSGGAILLTYLRDSAPNAVTGKVVREAVERYEFWRKGTRVTLTLSGPVGADNVDPWRIVSDSFTWQ